MKPESLKQSSDENGTTGRSVKKYLAVATMAASLGVSLGVAVVDALAAEGPASPPMQSRQGKFKSQMDQTKKPGSQQFKESSQFKEKQKIETKTGQSQVNK
jgi:hypothetical protein